MKHPRSEVVVVTGGAGRVGRRVVAQLLEHGRAVRSVDVVPWRDAPCPHTVADLVSFGETVDILRGAASVVHMAGIFAPGVRTDELTFTSNVHSTFNVFHAAALLGFRRVVWASTAAVAGAPFGDGVAPARVPLLETDRYDCSTTYALSKAAAEFVSTQPRLWNGTSFAALRFGRIYHPGEYAGIRSFWSDAGACRFNLWTYVDVRDVAQACELALEADISGAEAFFITAPDTVMARASAELVREQFPGADVAETLTEYGSLFSIDKARALLGYSPRHTWRQELEQMEATR